MRKRTLSCLITAAFLASSCGDGEDAREDKMRLKAIEAQWARALERHDGKFFEKILDADYEYVAYNGSQINRAEYIDNVNDYRIQDKTVRESGLSIRLINNTGVVTGVFTVTGRIDGEFQGITLRCTDVFVKRADQWIAAHGQATRILKSQSSTARALDN